MKHIIISVTSDMVTDQRVHRTAITLHEAGYKVAVFARCKNDSLPLPPVPYHIYRTRLWAEKGLLFYALYNIRLFFYLINTKKNILWSNDLDTLLPNFIISRLFGLKLIYDSHEYFTGVPELLHRPMVRNIWKIIERAIFPYLKYVITVNQSIADIYSQEYNVKINVVRNLPMPILNKQIQTPDILQYIYHPIIIYQGALNADRGIEEMIQAMEWIPNAILLIIGSGDLDNKIRQYREASHRRDFIILAGKIPYTQLPAYTCKATLGLSFEKPTNINYIYSLPNKIFDYIQAGVPVLATKLPEISTIIDTFGIGNYIPNHNPQDIAHTITQLLADKDLLATYKNNCATAASTLNWNTEKQKIIQLFENL
ncbi:MAG: glycosyltransferase [Cytophagales bacterium]|nr:glycosyltransferase [Cytophagales bacterium]